jgi:hypothetical protein
MCFLRYSCCEFYSFFIFPVFFLRSEFFFLLQNARVFCTVFILFPASFTAVCVLADASRVVGISTVPGVPSVAGLPSAVYACDDPIVSAAVHPTFTYVLVVSSCCCYCSFSTVADFPSDFGAGAAFDIHDVMLLSPLLLPSLMVMVTML